MPVSTLEAPQQMHRYKNDFRWRIMPGDAALTDGYHERSFPNKQKALKYQKLIKDLFPDETCALCDTGKYYDAHGHIYQTKGDR